MKIVTETYRCDIDGSHEGKVETFKVPIVISTDSDDGITKIPPRFELHNVDLCEKCRDRVYKDGMIIDASDVQGHYIFWFR